MSLDYALWKWKDDPPGITAGLCYLLQTASLECPEAVPLDTENLSRRIETAFPDLWSGADDFPFLCEVRPAVILLGAYGSTPASVLEWFVALAREEGMVFFDPQDRSSVTKADEREFRRREKLLEAEESAHRRERDLAELTARADGEDPKALFELGNRYSFGEGVRKDSRKAFDLFRRSAEAGSADGMFNLAACYRSGEGVKRDLAQAIAWYERAAETDKVYGPLALGEIYANGEAGEVARDKAISYLRIAWDHGNYQAGRLLKVLGALL